MIACKFLGVGAIGLYSGFRWPGPANGAGPWVGVEGPLVVGVNGVHACTQRELVNWIDDELWLIELAGEVQERQGVLVARRGRLLRRIAGWSEDRAREFATSCLLRVRGTAVRALSGGSEAANALALEEVNDLDRLQATAAGMIEIAQEPAASTLAYLADAVELIYGGRPESYGSHRGGGVGSTAGARAANLGFVVAHALGSAHADAVGDPAAYAAGFDAERDRQRAWLEHELALDRELATR